MEYIIILCKNAKDQLAEISDSAVTQAITALEANPRPDSHKKLQDSKFHEISTGGFKVVYEILDEELKINVQSVEPESPLDE